MPYTLDNFTQQAPPALLAQARALVTARAVTSLEKTDVEWLADVQDGDDLYTVAIDVGPHGELLSICTCDDGENDLCRHALATLQFAIERELAAGGVAQPAKAARPAKPAKARKPPKGSASARLRAVLEAAPHTVLVDLLMDVSNRNKQMQSRFYLQIVDVTTSFDAFMDALNGALSPPGGANAWYDAQTVAAVAKHLDLLLDRVEARATADVDSALRMALAVYEQITAVVERTTYFSGSLGQQAMRAFGIISLHIGNAGPEIRAGIMQTFAQRVKAAPAGPNVYILRLEQLLVELVQSPAERALVESLLKAPATPRDYYALGEAWDKNINNHVFLQYTLIARLDGAQAALRFAAANARYVAMRKVLIDQARARGDIATVKQLAGEGLKLAEKARLTEMVAHYRATLLEVASPQSDDAARLLLAEFLTQQNLANLTKYKQCFDAAAWPAARAKLLATPALNTDAIYMILHTEELWRELMDFVAPQTKSMAFTRDALQFSGQPLASLFPDEVAAWCKKTIDKGMTGYSVTRATLRAAIAILVEMKNRGLNAQAQPIVAALRKKYAAQPDVLKELAGL